MIINNNSEREVSMETDTQRELRLDDEEKDAEEGGDAENGENGDDKTEDKGDEAANSD